MVDGGLRGQGHLEVAVRAASEHISGSGRCGGRAYFVLPIRYQALVLFTVLFLSLYPSLSRSFFRSLSLSVPICRGSCVCIRRCDAGRHLFASAEILNADNSTRRGN